MMNYIWVALIVIAIVVGAATGHLQEVQDNLFEFAGTAVDICLGLIGVMAFFCGLMKLMEESGLSEKLARAISPLMRRLFKDVPEDHPAYSIMALYFAANILGLGNAATPFGLKTMQSLQTLNKTKNIATDAQVMLLAIATTSITIIPVTVMSLRSSVDKTGVAEIIGPIILATAISTVVGIVCTLLLGKFKIWNYDNIVAKQMAAGTLEINEDYIGPDPIVLDGGIGSDDVTAKKKIGGDSDENSI